MYVGMVLSRGEKTLQAAPGGSVFGPLASLEAGWRM
jgi:hypothetical protein